MHFALTGNARRQDGRLIVAATLYETVDVRQVWSQQFDRPDSPDERDVIIAVINSNFDLATNDAEVARAMREHPNDLDKRDLMFAQDTTVPAEYIEGEQSGADRADRAGTCAGSRLRLGATGKRAQACKSCE